jgi:hypothetical protein
MSRRKIKAAIKKYLPRQFPKIEAIASGAGINKLISYTVHFFEVINGIPSFVYRNIPQELPLACTQIFALPPATADGSFMFGRNYDFPTILKTFQMIRIDSPDDGYKHIGVSQYPWLSSHEALNEKGLCMGFNYGRCWKKADFSAKGVPSTMLLQEAIETCATTQEAIDLIQKFPARANGGHYGIMDASGDTAVVETTRSRWAVRRPTEGILVHTNTYLTPEMQDANLPMDVRFKMADMDFSPIESPIRRLKRASFLMDQKRGQITMDTLKAILRDHDNGDPNREGPDDFSLCTHGHSSDTLASFIAFPKKKELWYTLDHPCENEYEKITL